MTAPLTVPAAGSAGAAQAAGAATRPATASAGPAGRPPAVTVRDLTKRYGDVRAVDGISFDIAEGETVAILGPNGAGKTTTVEILEGFRPATSGTVRVLGEDPARASAGWRARLGIVLQSCGIEDELRVEEVLRLHAAYYPSPRPIDEILGLVGLEEHRRRRVSKLSGGQQRRVDLALGLIGDPQLLFLDEPTTGFDPSARRAAWSVVRGLCSLGKTVVLTTHYLDEAQELADRIIVVARGRVVAEGTPDTLGDRANAAARVQFSIPVGIDPAEVAAVLAAYRPRVEDTTVWCETRDPGRAVAVAAGWADRRGFALDGLTVTRPSLEDVYLALTEDDAAPAAGTFWCRPLEEADRAHAGPGAQNGVITLRGLDAVAAALPELADLCRQDPLLGRSAPASLCAVLVVGDDRQVDGVLLGGSHPVDGTRWVIRPSLPDAGGTDPAVRQRQLGAWQAVLHVAAGTGQVAEVEVGPLDEPARRAIAGLGFRPVDASGAAPAASDGRVQGGVPG
ncbi:MAG: ABC transporter ATP-binding protein [Acidimicrobiia bacterium]